MDERNALCELIFQVSTLNDLAARIASWIKMVEASGVVPAGTWDTAQVEVDRLKLQVNAQAIGDILKDMSDNFRSEDPFFKILSLRAEEIGQQLKRMGGGDA